MTTEEFSGFPPDGLAFLHSLGTKDKAWFNSNRPRYQANLVAPTRAFIVALGQGIAATFAPAIIAQPKTNGSIPPINNDLRFSPNKSPYKDHLLLKFWEGADKQTAPKLFVRIGRDQIGFSAGARIAPPDVFRDRVDDAKSGPELSAALATLAERYPIEIGDEKLKRVPKPYPPGHPRADLLKHKGIFHVRWPEPTPPEIHHPEFIDYCLTRLDACAELHHWLVRNL